MFEENARNDRGATGPNLNAFGRRNDDTFVHDVLRGDSLSHGYVGTFKDHRSLDVFRVMPIGAMTMKTLPTQRSLRSIQGYILIASTNLRPHGSSRVPFLLCRFRH